METEEIIRFLQSRRSIRKYTEQSLREEEIQSILETAVQAPSAKNFQALHFVLLKEKEGLEAMMKAHPHASMLKYAGAALLICGDKNLQEEIGYLSLDAAAATMNVLLAAHAMKIGSCWLGVYPREERMKEISAYLNLPEHIVPLTMIALGHTDVSKEIPSRWKEERLHKEKW